MYMVHAPVLVLFQRVTSRFRLVDASLVGRGLTLFGLMSAVFLAAHIGYRLIEEPSRRLITGKRSKKRKSSVSRSATPSGVKR
jgi:peptidoglycan/LPS O-acetylase OafA/YrhL